MNDEENVSAKSKTGEIAGFRDCNRFSALSLGGQ
jgi:hypothetical protein